jgi:DNA-binding MarR family transcriptional regulator
MPMQGVQGLGLEQVDAGYVSTEAPRKLIELVGREVRRMGVQSVLMGRAVADRFGMHPTDLETLDLIVLSEETTAGDLAKATGLTSGAMTTVVDRLERAGYVIRVADPDDRRRHFIRVKPEAGARVGATYDRLEAAVVQLWSGYSDDELKLILDFLTRSTDAAVTFVEQISQEASPPRGGRSSARMRRRAASARQEDTA